MRFFESSSPCLALQPAFSALATAVVAWHARLATPEAGRRVQSMPRALVVCERGSDKPAILAQVRAALAAAGNPRVALCLQEPEEIGRSLFENELFSPGLSVALPYFSVEEQKSLIQVLLLAAGHLGGPNLVAVTNAMHTLVSLAWPKDVTFLELLLETQTSEEAGTQSRELTEYSLRTLLATFQVSQSLLSQTVDLSKLATHSALSDTQSLHAFISQNLSLQGRLRTLVPEIVLWVRAPEIQNSQPLGRHLSDAAGSLCQTVSLVHETLHGANETRLVQPHEPSVFLVARCVLAAPKAGAEIMHTTPIICRYARNKSSYFRLVANAQALPEKTLFVSGNLNLLTHARVATDASGFHNVTHADLERFETQFAAQGKHLSQATSQRPSPGFTAHAESDINSALKVFAADFSQAADLISSHINFASEVWQSYQLPDLHDLMSGRPRTHIFRQFALGKPIAVGNFPRELFQYNVAPLLFGNPTGDKVIVAGPPTSERPVSSFYAGLLTDVLSHLKRRGVSVEDTPSQGVLGNAFWKAIENLGLPCEFWCLDYADIESCLQAFDLAATTPLAPLGDLPIYEHRSTVDDWLPRDPESGCHTKVIPDWPARFKWRTTPEGAPIVGVTDFEVYVQCPLQFFWRKLMGLEKGGEDFETADHLDIGNRTHKIAESFLSRLRMAFSAQSLVDAVPFLSGAQQILHSESLFLSTQVSDWMQAFDKLVGTFADHLEATAGALTLRAGFHEICSLIFADENISLFADLPFPSNTVGQDPYQQGLRREILKRTFRRLVDVELLRLQQGPLDTLLAFAEHPLTFKLGGLALAGRIDRIDHGACGFHIIDYKSSRVPKAERSLVLFPSEKSSRSQLSVQAALYSYAWCKEQAALAKELRELNTNEGSTHDGGKHDIGVVKSFALYRLKTLDDQADSLLTKTFDPPLSPESSDYLRIEACYGAIAEGLRAGDFSARPLEDATCKVCAFVKICPKGRSPDGENLSEGAD